VTITGTSDDHPSITVTTMVNENGHQQVEGAFTTVFHRHENDMQVRVCFGDGSNAGDCYDDKLPRQCLGVKVGADETLVISGTTWPKTNFRFRSKSSDIRCDVIN